MSGAETTAGAGRRGLDTTLSTAGVTTHEILQESTAPSLVLVYGPDRERFGARVKPGPGKPLAINRATTIFGGPLSDRSMSREHAALGFSKKDEALTLTDKGSKQGTFVNGANIGEGPVLLADHDVVRIGQTLFVVESVPVLSGDTDETAARFPDEDPLGAALGVRSSSHHGR